MDDTITLAGWGRPLAGIPEHVYARQEAEERRENAAAQRERELRLEEHRERNLIMAMDQAVLAGQLVSRAETIRSGGANNGHTRAEFIALKSAEMDAEDARARRKAQRELDRITAEHHLSMLGDTTAPTEQEQAVGRAALDARREEIERGRAIRTQRRVIQGEIVRSDRRKQMGLPW
jgi:hypothetical protein